MTELAIVALASLFAGCVDAIVGGGGLILVPALFGMYPGAAPATLLGTNKGSRHLGHGLGHRAVRAPRTAALALAAAGGGRGAGGQLRRRLGAHVGQPCRLAQGAAAGARRRAGLHAGAQGPRPRARATPAAAQTATACAIGAVVGAYDGFFGPGAGSFFVFLFVRLLGFDFLHASASAKLLNTATNAAALLLLAAKGHVWWHVAAVLALANVTGSLIGTRLALRHGAGFVRGAFIVVVTALIAKTGWDAFSG